MNCVCFINLSSNVALLFTVDCFQSPFDYCDTDKTQLAAATKLLFS